MTWLKLTMKDGSPLRLNSDLIEAYQEDGEGTILSANDGGYAVNESIKEIDKMLLPQMIVEMTPKQLEWK